VLAALIAKESMFDPDAHSSCSRRSRGVQNGGTGGHLAASLASSVISVPARACDTGQPALAAWACCMKIA